LGVLLGLTVLAVDGLNPVKLFIHVFPEVKPWHVATFSTLLSISIWFAEFKALVYFMVRVFLNSILSIFFRDIEIIGRDNLPRHGPMIFSINHANQFVDAALVLGCCGDDFKVSYMMAEASWKRRIIGDLARALDVVPVKRAQDSAIRGQGTVVFTKHADFETSHLMDVKGVGTDFVTTMKLKDKIRPVGTATGVKVVEIKDETTIVVLANAVPEADLENVFGKKEPSNYDILKYVDLKVTFEKVLDRLATGGVVGIFPEGGSHDRTDLLPLKVGVALIAYSSLERDGLNVPIVPVGLNYFGTHKWRGKAIVEFGQPVYIDPSTLKDYEAGGEKKITVCNELLDRIKESMRSVIVSTPDYDTLQLIHTARRLYQRKGITGKERQDLMRRFAAAYKILMTSEDAPQPWLDLQERVKTYRRELRDLGLRDYQVAGLDREEHDKAEEIQTDVRVVYKIFHLLIILVLTALPNLFLNVPVRIMADIYAERRRAKALAKSKVKIHGYDVMLTEKLTFCIVAVPSLWIFYALFLALFTNADAQTITLCIMSFPLFAYTGVVAAEAGMVDAKDLKPYFLRLLPSNRRRLRQLPGTRRGLQRDVRAFIKQVGPALGDLYYGKELDWEQVQEIQSKSTEIMKKVMSENEGFVALEADSSIVEVEAEMKKDK